MKKLVEKKGQKFEFQNQILEVESFYGESGIEFETAKKAIKENPKSKIICVKNKEFGGATELSKSYLVE